MGFDPFEHAEKLGIQVLYRRIRTANGLWLPDRNLIVIKDGMRAVHTRAALAHELGHVHHGHADDRPKHEIQADRWAANQLIERSQFDALAGWVEHPQRMAAELGVTQRLFRAYVNHHRLTRAS